MSATLTTTQPDAATEAAIARFAFWQAGIAQDALSLKLRTYFAGLEIEHLRSHFEAIHGPIRRGGSKDSRPLVAFSTWIEENLQVTSRTANRYLAQFRDITTTAPKVAAKLNQWWEAEMLPRQINEGNADKTTLQSREDLANLVPAASLQTLLTHADEWGLNDLLEQPLKQAKTSGGSSGSGDDEPLDAKAREKQLLLDFWCQQLPRRLDRDEILRLPKREREALATRLEETLNKVKATLQPKPHR